MVLIQTPASTTTNMRLSNVVRAVGSECRHIPSWCRRPRLRYCVAERPVELERFPIHPSPPTGRRRSGSRRRRRRWPSWDIVDSWPFCGWLPRRIARLWSPARARRPCAAAWSVAFEASHNFCDKGDCPEECHSAHGLVGLDHWRHRPGCDQFRNLLLQARKARLGIFDRLVGFDAFTRSLRD